MSKNKANFHHFNPNASQKYAQKMEEIRNTVGGPDKGLVKIYSGKP